MFCLHFTDTSDTYFHFRWDNNNTNLINMNLMKFSTRLSMKASHIGRCRVCVCVVWVSLFSIRLFSLWMFVVAVAVTIERKKWSETATTKVPLITPKTSEANNISIGISLSLSLILAISFSRQSFNSPISLPVVDEFSQNIEVIIKCAHFVSTSVCYHLFQYVLHFPFNQLNINSAASS